MASTTFMPRTMHHKVHARLSHTATGALRNVVQFQRRAQGISRSPFVANAAADAAATVKLVIQGRKLPVTKPIKDYVETKLIRATENYEQIITKVDVTLSARGGDTGTHGKREQKVEVTISTLKNGVVRVEDAEDNLYAAIDNVCDKVERKLQKVKEIAITKNKWPGRAGPHEVSEERDFQEYVREILYETRVAEAQEALEQELAAFNTQPYPAQVMRAKKLDLTKMSVADAIEAMEAVGHDFYLFLESDTKEMQVVYRRKAGGYGVLIPNK